MRRPSMSDRLEESLVNKKTPISTLRGIRPRGGVGRRNAEMEGWGRRRDGNHFTRRKGRGFGDAEGAAAASTDLP